MPLDFDFFFLFFLLPWEDPPPRSCSQTKGSDDRPFLNVGVGHVFVVVVVLIPVANFEKDEQRITKDKSVLIVQDCDILIPGLRINCQTEASQEFGDNRDATEFCSISVLYLWLEIPESLEQ